MISFHHDISHMKPMTWGNRSMEPHLSRLISSMAQRRTYSHAPDDDNRTRTRAESIAITKVSLAPLLLMQIYIPTNS